MKYFQRSTLGAVVTLIALASPAQPMVKEGVEFQDAVRVQGADLRLQGVGLLRYMVLIKAYVAALYLPAQSPPASALNDVAKRLEIVYFHPIEAEGFRNATIRGIRNNFSEEEFQRLSPRVEALNRLYRDVAPGDRYALTYVPGSGTTLSLNGEFLGSLDGADFAAAVFAIWLGPNPLDEGLKDSLLGKTP